MLQYEGALQGRVELVTGAQQISLSHSTLSFPAPDQLGRKKETNSELIFSFNAVILAVIENQMKNNSLNYQNE